MRKTVTGTLVNACIVDAVNNQWELTLMVDDEMANVRKYKVRSKYPFTNSEIRRFKLTLKGDNVVRTEALY